MGQKTHTACSGCSLCLLSCPVWRATHDIRLTPHGRAKAMQHGATAADLKESIESCTLCGACEPACPENIPLMGMIDTLRREIGLAPSAVPPAPTFSLTLSTLSALRNKLNADDLYVIETRNFHADHARLIQHYDALRATTGCAMNLDLQRMAIPTTVGTHHSGRVNAEDQARWILEGRTPKRIVVEDTADIAVFMRVTALPVVHFSELLDGKPRA